MNSVSDLEIYRKQKERYKLITFKGGREYNESDLEMFACRKLSRDLPNGLTDDFERYSNFDTYADNLSTITLPGDTAGALRIDEAIKRYITIHSDKLCRLGDIGYGAGMALLQMRSLSGWENLVLYGIGYNDIPKYIFTNDETRHLSAYDVLMRNGIHLIEGNILNINRMNLPKMDIFLASGVLPYIRASHFGLMKKIYNRLEVGGFIAVDGFYQFYDDYDKMVNEDGNQYEIDGLSDAWREYFAALTKIGCVIDVPQKKASFGKERHQLVVYKLEDIMIPDSIEGIRRPTDNYFS